MSLISWYNQDLASYGISSKNNEDILIKMQEIAKNYSTSEVKEEILTALKNGDSEKLAEISANLPTTQEASEYIKYLQKQGETIEEDKNFKFYANPYKNVGVSDELWFTHELALGDTYQEHNDELDSNNMAQAVSNMYINMLTNKTETGKKRSSLATEYHHLLFSSPFGGDTSVRNRLSEMKAKLDKLSDENSQDAGIDEKVNSKTIKEVLNERTEYYDVDDETIKSRMVNTDETPEEYEKRFERSKYIYTKTLEYLNRMKDYLLDFNIIKPDEYKSDRLLDVKA